MSHWWSVWIVDLGFLWCCHPENILYTCGTKHCRSNNNVLSLKWNHISIGNYHSFLSVDVQSIDLQPMNLQWELFFFFCGYDFYLYSLQVCSISIHVLITTLTVKDKSKIVLHHLKACLWCMHLQKLSALFLLFLYLSQPFSSQFS